MQDSEAFGQHPKDMQDTTLVEGGTLTSVAGGGLNFVQDQQPSIPIFQQATETGASRPTGGAQVMARDQGAVNIRTPHIYLTRAEQATHPVSTAIAHGWDAHLGADLGPDRNRPASPSHFAGPPEDSGEQLPAASDADNGPAAQRGTGTEAALQDDEGEGFETEDRDSHMDQDDEAPVPLVDFTVLPEDTDEDEESTYPRPEFSTPGRSSFLGDWSMDPDPQSHDENMVNTGSAVKVQGPVLRTPSVSSPKAVLPTHVMSAPQESSHDFCSSSIVDRDRDDSTPSSRSYTALSPPTFSANVSDDNEPIDPFSNMINIQNEGRGLPPNVSPSTAGIAGDSLVTDPLPPPSRSHSGDEQPIGVLAEEFSTPLAKPCSPVPDNSRPSTHQSPSTNQEAYDGISEDEQPMSWGEDIKVQVDQDESDKSLSNHPSRDRSPPPQDDELFDTSKILQDSRRSPRSFSPMNILRQDIRLSPSRDRHRFEGSDGMPVDVRPGPTISHEAEMHSPTLGDRSSTIEDRQQPPAIPPHARLNASPSYAPLANAADESHQNRAEGLAKYPVSDDETPISVSSDDRIVEDAHGSPQSPMFLTILPSGTIPPSLDHEPKWSDDDEVPVDVRQSPAAYCEGEIGPPASRSRSPSLEYPPMSPAIPQQLAVAATPPVRAHAPGGGAGNVHNEPSDSDEPVDYGGDDVEVRQGDTDESISMSPPCFNPPISDDEVPVVMSPKVKIVEDTHGSPQSPPFLAVLPSGTIPPSPDHESKWSDDDDVPVDVRQSPAAYCGGEIGPPASRSRSPSLDYPPMSPSIPQQLAVAATPPVRAHAPGGGAENVHNEPSDSDEPVDYGGDDVEVRQGDTDESISMSPPCFNPPISDDEVPVVMSPKVKIVEDTHGSPQSPPFLAVLPSGTIPPSLDHEPKWSDDDEVPVDVRQSPAAYCEGEIGPPASRSRSPSLDYPPMSPAIPQQLAVAATPPVRAHAPGGGAENVHNESSDSDEPVDHGGDDSEVHQAYTGESSSRSPSRSTPPIVSLNSRPNSDNSASDDEELIRPFSMVTNLWNEGRGLFRSASPATAGLPDGLLTSPHRHRVRGLQTADVSRGEEVSARVSDTPPFMPYSPISGARRDGLGESFPRGYYRRNDLLLASSSYPTFRDDVSDDEPIDASSSVKVLEDRHESPQGSPPTTTVHSPIPLSPSPARGHEGSDDPDERPIDPCQGPIVYHAEPPTSRSRSPTPNRVSPLQTHVPLGFIESVEHTDEEPVDESQDVQFYEESDPPSLSPLPVGRPLGLPSSPWDHLLVEESLDRQEPPRNGRPPSLHPSPHRAFDSPYGEGDQGSAGEKLGVIDSERPCSSSRSSSSVRPAEDRKTSPPPRDFGSSPRGGRSMPDPIGLEVSRERSDDSFFDYFLPGAYPTETAVPTQHKNSDSTMSDDEDPIDVGPRIPSLRTTLSRRRASAAPPEITARAFLRPPQENVRLSDDEEPVAVKPALVKEDSESGYDGESESDSPADSGLSDKSRPPSHGSCRPSARRKERKYRWNVAPKQSSTTGTARARKVKRDHPYPKHNKTSPPRRVFDRRSPTDSPEPGASEKFVEGTRSRQIQERPDTSSSESNRPYVETTTHVVCQSLSEGEQESTGFVHRDKGKQRAISPESSNSGEEPNIGFQDRSGESASGGLVAPGFTLSQEMAEAAYTNMIGSNKRAGKHDIALMWIDLSNRIEQRPPSSKSLGEPNTHVAPATGTEPQQVQRPVNEVKHRDPRDNKMRATMREEAFKMMQRTEIPGQSYHPIASIDFSHIKRWKKAVKKKDKKRLRRYAPTAEHIVLFLAFADDLSGAHKKDANAWNKENAVQFSVEFCKIHPQYETQRASVQTAFMTHIKTLKYHYKLHVNQPDVYADRAISLRVRSARERRVNRHDRRRRMCFQYREEDTGIMLIFYNIFTYDLPWIACSGDEYESAKDDDGDSDEELFITTLDWRAEDVREFMETLDDLYLAWRFRNGIHATSGNFPIPRKAPAEVKPETRAKVPQGLPSNFYREGWLNGLEPYEREQLNMQDPVELKFPKKIKDLADTAESVVGRSTRPAGRNFDD